MMESYGIILKKAREEKNLDRETVARETSITIEYIKGLEEEESGVFPGEPYMIGFLRNYAEYLGINPETVMTLYRSKTIQEAPMPEGLLVKHKPRFFWPLVIGMSCFAVVAVVATILLIIKFKQPGKNRNVIIAHGAMPKNYELSDRPLKARLFHGDQISYPSEKGKIILAVSETLGSFGLSTPVGTLYVDLAEEAELDVDGDAQGDVIVYVSDISSTDASRGAEVRMLLRRQDDDMLSIDSIVAADIMSESEVRRAHQPRIILEDNRAYPFTVNAVFRGSCVFRSKIDRRQSEENYFMNGEIITMTANNSLRIWMSNGNTVKFTVIADTRSFDLDIGAAGQVLVQDIRWVRDSEGRYRLVVVEID
ncbi:MAG: helix-turn-helix domain-containing protein [Treponema sp.]|nr:helix-turn-helix domain-containing protein [Treponema sp.]